MKFIKVSNIKINVDESVDKAFEKAIKEAGINNKDIIEQKIVKYSLMQDIKIVLKSYIQ